MYRHVNILYRCRHVHTGKDIYIDFAVDDQRYQYTKVPASNLLVYDALPLNILQVHHRPCPAHPCSLAWYCPKKLQFACFFDVTASTCTRVEEQSSLTTLYQFCWQHFRESVNKKANKFSHPLIRKASTQTETPFSSYTDRHVSPGLPKLSSRGELHRARLELHRHHSGGMVGRTQLVDTSFLPHLDFGCRRSAEERQKAGRTLVPAQHHHHPPDGLVSESRNRNGRGWAGYASWVVAFENMNFFPSPSLSLPSLSHFNPPPSLPIYFHNTSLVGTFGVGPKYLVDEYAVLDTRYWVLKDPCIMWVSYSEMFIQLPLEFAWYIMLQRSHWSRHFWCTLAGMTKIVTYLITQIPSSFLIVYIL